MRIRVVIVLVALAALAIPQVAAADVATDWNRTMVDALLVSHTAPQPGTRIAAIVQSSAFDAVNGVAQRYAQFHPDVLGGATAPRGASKAASVAGAAYTALVALFPAQKATFDAQRAATLSQLSDDSADDIGTGRAITRGLAWGQTVANAFLTWRSTDGLTAVLPPYVVGLLPFWQPTLPAFAGPTLRQFAAMTPWAMSSPSQFLPPPAPALTSAQYATDFNEVETIGDAVTATPENVATAQFWNGKPGGGGDTVATIWNRAADELSDAHPVPLVDNARRFALLDVSMADAVIAIWNAKNVYNTWRPITAIRNADIDGNDATLANATWTPVLPTPPFQEYPSGHSGVSAAAAAQLSSFYGNDTPFSVTSDGLPGVTRIYASFSDAIADVALARVAGGIHFRFACDVAAQMGAAIAAQATAKQMTRLHGENN
jgi:hypothetical protein